MHGDLREGEGHQGPTDHYEVQNVPEVTEVGPLMQDKAQVDHLEGENSLFRALNPLLGKHPLEEGGTGRMTSGPSEEREPDLTLKPSSISIRVCSA